MDGNIVLIKMIKKNPLIWKYNHKNKRSEESREVFWKEVAKTIGADVDWIIQRWKNLCAEFFKNYKIYLAKKGDCKINFKYFDQMQFLTKITQKKVEPQFNTEESHQLLSINSGVNKNLEFVLTESVLNKTSNANYFTYNDRPEEVKLEAQNIHKTTQKMQTEYEAVDENLPINNSKKTRCEDSIFGELVIAMLKEFPPDKKKNVKKQIMNILLS